MQLWSPVFLPETTVSSPLSRRFRSVWGRVYIRMHCQLLVPCLFLINRLPSSHPNDNSVYVKCAAFGPLGHRTLHATAPFTAFYCVSFVSHLHKGRTRPSKFSKTKFFSTCECMCTHTHPEQLVRGMVYLNIVTPFPMPSAGPTLTQLGFLDVNTDNIDLNKTNLPLRNSVLTPFHSYSLPASSLSLFLSLCLFLCYITRGWCMIDRWAGIIIFFFLRNLRPCSVIGLPADISKPRLSFFSPLSLTLSLISALMILRGKKVGREKDMYLREEPQWEGGNQRTSRSVCASVWKRHLLS